MAEVEGAAVDRTLSHGLIMAAAVVDRGEEVEEEEGLVVEGDVIGGITREALVAEGQGMLGLDPGEAVVEEEGDEGVSTTGGSIGCRGAARLVQVHGAVVAVDRGGTRAGSSAVR